MQSRIKNTCDTIQKETSDVTSWEWDDRFNTALCVLPQEKSGDVYSLVKKEFTENWATESITAAPKIIQNLSGEILGVRQGQFLFTKDSLDRVIVFAAWWPWESDQRVSLRIGLHALSGAKYKSKELHGRLKEWFRIR